MKVEDIQCYYISFKKQIELENSLRATGFPIVHHFNAIDGRKINLESLLYENKLSKRAYTDTVDGRKEHMGLSSMGAIGCYLSHLALCR